MGKPSCSIQFTGNASGWLLKHYCATCMRWQWECKFFIMYTCAHWSSITRSALCPPLAIQEALCWPTFSSWIMLLTLLHTCDFCCVNYWSTNTQQPQHTHTQMIMKGIVPIVRLKFSEKRKKHRCPQTWCSSFYMIWTIQPLFSHNQEIIIT